MSTKTLAMERETLCRFKFMSAPLLAPGGRRLVYRETRVDAEANRYLARLRLIDLETGHNRVLTSGAIGGAVDFLDENSLVFSAEREPLGDAKGDAQGEAVCEGAPYERKSIIKKPETALYRMALDGGEADLWLRLPCVIERFYCLDENELLIQAAETPESRALEEAEKLPDNERAQCLKRLAEAREYEVLEEIPFWFNGNGYTSGHISRLYHYDLRDGRLSPISPEGESAQILDIDRRTREESGGVRRLLYCRQKSAPVLGLYNRLFYYDLDTGTETEIAFERRLDFRLAAFAGDTVVFAASDLARFGLNEDGGFYSWKAEEAVVRELYPDAFLESQLMTDLALDDGNWYQGVPAEGGRPAGLYYLTTQGTSSHIAFLSLDGERRLLGEHEGAVLSFAIGKNEGYEIAMRGENAGALYRLGLEGAEEIQLADANKWLEAYALCPLESFQFCVGDDELTGFVLLPESARQGKRCPGILTIHGGPKATYGRVLNHEMQVLAARGYAVFFTNPRGSDGRGRDWADLRGRYGEIDYRQLMALTDEVLRRYPVIDERRLGVIGGSYGGFMTNWIIGHTGRFAAACTQRSISNWSSMFGISDIGYYFCPDQVGEDLWAKPEFYWEKSPLKYAPRVTTPTLIIHSDQDYRCPLAEGQQLFTALKLRGVEARLVIFKGENHQLSRSGKPRHRLRRLEEIERWFARWLDGETGQSDREAQLVSAAESTEY